MKVQNPLKVAFLAAGLGLFGWHSIDHIHAATATGATCPADVLNQNSLNCTANDVALVSVIVTNGVTSCVAGTDVTLDLDFGVGLNANGRYDIGLWISEDGLDILEESSAGGATSCTVSDFPQSPLPFDDLDGDVCGDVSSTGTGTVSVNGVTIPCQPDANGFLAIRALASWDTNAGGVCTTPEGTVPSTKSKCSANLFTNVFVDVVGTLTIQKQAVPGETAWDFDYTATSPDTITPSSFTLNHGDEQVLTTGALSAATTQTITVTETIANGWDVSSVTCTGATSFSVASNVLTVDIDATNSNPVCVFNNLGNDHGDAPSSYGSASHDIDPDLLLGSVVDHDSADWHNGADANGNASDDDGESNAAGAPDDEDSTGFSAVDPNLTQTYTLFVTVTNDTGANATLYGWMDFDCNGAFDVLELATAIVANGDTQASLQWGDGITNMAAACNGETETYARLRLSSDVLASPTGTASDGEVEDYQVPVGNAFTPAVISDFHVQKSQNGRILYWESASEVGVSALRVERLVNINGQQHWQPVHQQSWLPAAYALQGANYQLQESTDVEVLAYRIIERGLNGQKLVHGPFSSAFASDSVAPVSAKPFKSVSRFDVDRVIANQNARNNRLAKAGKVSGSKLYKQGSDKKEDGFGDVNSRLKLTVAEPGVYFVSANQLSEHFSLRSRKVSKWLAKGRFKLTDRGHAVAWHKVQGGLLFYGQASDVPWSDERVYILEAKQSGLPMSTTSIKAVNVAYSRFIADQASEQDNFAVFDVTSDVESDYWYWSSMINSAPYNTGDFVLPAVAASGLPAILDVHLQGGSAGDHRVEVLVNGMPLGVAEIADISSLSAQFELPAELLGNDLTVTLKNITENGFSLYYVDGFNLHSSQEHIINNGFLTFAQDASGGVKISGLTGKGQNALLDISDRQRPVWVTGPREQKATMSAQLPAGKYVIAEQGAWKQPGISYAAGSPALNPQLEYLVITADDLIDGAQALADYRSTQFNTQVVPLSVIYDQSSFGRPDPKAIQTFLRSLNKKPDFVALVGDGSYDYRDIYDTGYNLLSPMLIDSSTHGFVVSDTLLGDITGDGRAEIPVGRIPAKTNAEVQSYVNKVAAYENAAHYPTLMLADNPDGVGDFSFSSDVISLQNSNTVKKLYLENQSTEDLRNNLVLEMNAGIGLINYVGHGGLDRLAEEGLLTNGDIPGLTNSTTPILVGLTCNINNFSLPGFDALGENLLMQTAHGMVASWAASSMSANSDAQMLGLEFQRQLMTSSRHLGNAMRDALQQFPGLENVYTLLGDPALEVR